MSPGEDSRLGTGRAVFALGLVDTLGKPRDAVLRETASCPFPTLATTLQHWVRSETKRPAPLRRVCPASV